jgi:SAM-dependent methyltransferase
METTLAERMNSFYENSMFGADRSLFERVDKIGFFNLGYWKGVEDSIELAQINLIETLVRFFSNKDGNILDVACGKGASSKFLTKYFDPNGITGINIAKRQLEICKLIAPECTFQLMDATKLEFGNSSFDNVLCIEAALHFLTRYKFFEEAYRVLKPAGRLAMLDFLCDYDLLEGAYAAHAPVLPKENYLPNLDTYRESLLKAGFKYVRVEDCTDLTVRAVTSYEIRMAEMEFGKKQDCDVLEKIRNITLKSKILFAGCMVYAIK